MEVNQEDEQGAQPKHRGGGRKRDAKGNYLFIHLESVDKIWMKQDKFGLIKKKTL